nr:hybrid sensor histidine kinase/response regulator [Pseudanabaena sp. PCC 6802]
MKVQTTEQAIVGQKTLLVVDDEPDNFDVIDILLFKEGYQLYHVQSGQAALEFLNRQLPDVIILDVMMSEMDGLQVCKILKANPQWRHIPILIVTALVAKEDLARCLDAGADDFLSKPVNGLELRARVNSMLRIKQQYDAIQLALKLKEDMTSAIIHDLRNPMTNIQLACDLLAAANLPDKPRKKVAQIATAIQRLRSLVDDILIVARIEAGKLSLNLSEVDLADMGAQVLADFEEIATDKRIQLVGNLPETGTCLQLDANLVRRTIDNLLANAIKFSPPASQIKLQVDYPKFGACQARIAVFDAGPGVSEAKRQVIFERYEVGTPIGGVPQIGLGLSFCKMVAEAHGGCIFVESNQPVGSIFTVELGTIDPATQANVNFRSC